MAINIPQFKRPPDQEQWAFSRGFRHGYAEMKGEKRPYTSDLLNIAYQAGWSDGWNQRIQDERKEGK